MPKAVVLARYPQGEIAEEDFAVAEVPMPAVEEGFFLIKNRLFSLDAGFRAWMNEGAGDNYLEGMKLNEPVQSIVLGEVIESRHPDYPVGAIVNARTAWEEFSVLDGSDLTSILETTPGVPLHEYMSTLGPTGVTAWIGLMEVGKPQRGDTVVVSAAGGAVGTVVGQLAKAEGCYTVGLTSSAAKAKWLVEEVGYDAAISREESPDLDAALKQALPEGIDLFFDNVGGAALNTVMGQLRENARLVLCGAISQYEAEAPDPVTNCWELITKRARMEGFMFSDYIDQFPAIMDDLGRRLKKGELKGFDQQYHGIEKTPQAFCDMMHGNARGKCLVTLD
ncbi:alcohol dehydrogenase, zinc-binding domain protein [Luminiphilus syltensis NOR5-1B]|uniref:Alcohol dehydrogenase, zinc-binding domain protein n=1 Tax=Luminiphilus syltensis NOR5-1B TaxID=565045 RepID=B8KSN2_9GAMM|nr:NADP-dependent oxidoreductase [Luminiphilus syltensis]EED36444.1 alcohol dehydrogenase, zinc-binding domain protein [Luminiphilus syltensis NOR5-1B]